MTTSSESLYLLNRVADLRAHGNPWNEAAKQLATDADAMRRLVAQHQRDYDKLARRARVDAARETFDAALAALRNLLKSEDSRVSLLAATTIVRYEMARLRRGTKSASEQLTRESRRVRRLPVESADQLEPLPRLEQLEPWESVDANASEPVKVLKLPEVTAAKKDVKPLPPMPARPVAALSEATRRRERLLTAAVMNQYAPTPTVRNGPKNGVGKVTESWLTE